MGKRPRKIFLIQFFFYSKEDVDHLIREIKGRGYGSSIYCRPSNCSLVSSFRSDQAIRSISWRIRVRRKKKESKYLVRTRTLYFSCRSLLQDALYVLYSSEVKIFRFNVSANELQVRLEDFESARKILKNERIKNTLARR